jgi:hypothetical protein
MINVCSENHDEVAYIDRECPMCVLIGQHKEALSDERDKVKVLESELSDALAEIQLLREPVICAVKVIREEMLNESPLAQSP